MDKCNNFSDVAVVVKYKKYLLSTAVAFSLINFPTHASKEMLTLCAPEEEPKQSLVGSMFSSTQEIFGDAYSNLTTNAKVSYEIFSQLRRGDTSKFTEEVVSAFISHLAGRDHTNMFSANKEEFDDIAMSEATKKLTKKVFKELKKFTNRRKDLMGRVRDTGQVVDIYDTKTILSRLADNIIPNSVPARGAVVSLLNTPIIEEQVRDALTTYIRKSLEQIAKNQGTSVKKVIGGSPKAVYEFMTAESAFDIKALIKYLPKGSHPLAQEIIKLIEPRLKHAYREAFKAGLEKARDSVIRKVDLHLREKVSRSVQAGTAVVGANTGYLLSEVAQFGLDCVPGVNYINRYIPMESISTLVGGGMGWVFGGFLGNSTYDHLAKTCKSHSQRSIEWAAWKAVTLTAEEHALYYLNPEPSPSELEINSLDYERRDDISITVLNALKAIANYAGVQGILEAAYEKGSDAYSAAEKALKWLSGHKGANQDQFMLEFDKLNEFVHPHQKYMDTREHGLRRLELLKQSDPNQYRKTLENLREHPSFDVKAVQLGIAKAEGRESEAATKRREARHGTVASLRSVSALIANSTGFAEADVLSAVMDLSVQDQDVLVDAYKIDGTNITKDFEHETLEDDLANKVNALAKRAFEGYLHENGKEIEQLQNHSIALGLNVAEVVELHKRLSSKGNEGLKAGLLELDLETAASKRKALEISKIKERLAQITLEQKGAVLVDIFEEQLKESGAYDSVVQALSKVEEAQMAATIGSLLAENETYQKELKPLMEVIMKRDGDYGTIKAGYNAQRLFLMNKMVEDAKQLSKSAQKPETPISSGSWSLFSKQTEEEWKCPETTMVQEALQKKLLKTPLALYGEDHKTSIGLFEMTKRVNEDHMIRGAFKVHPSEFVEEQFEGIHQSILDNKVNALKTLEDQKFVKRYQGELYALMIAEHHDYYEDRLFYGLPNAISLLKIRNEKIIRALFTN